MKIKFLHFNMSAALDSKIITSESDIIQFLTLFDKNLKFKLLMRGSKDGFKGQTFLDKCSEKRNTVTIVKDTNGKVYGGYTDIAFDGSQQYK